MWNIYGNYKHMFYTLSVKWGKKIFIMDTILISSTHYTKISDGLINTISGTCIITLVSNQIKCILKFSVISPYIVSMKMPLF